MKLNIGDIVVLNDIGLDVAFGQTLGLAYMKTKKMIVKKIDHLDDNSELDIITVDDPEISTLLLFSRCFDKVDP